MSNDLLESFKARYAFPLDPFQLDAIRAIQDGKSVIVSAPTGSGKTLVAEFAIHATLARQRRIAYTTPLKALSNQKYADFCRQFGSEHVGILTGDVKVNARASVVVMTTEILRNMFYTGGLDGLEFVVLDECHYMGDEGRGTVWEEIIVNAPGTSRWWAFPRPSGTSPRSPTGSASFTARSFPSRTRTAACRSSTSWPISRGRSTPTTRSAAARCASSARSARAATTTRAAGTRAAWSTRR